MADPSRCPNCGVGRLEVFYRMRKAPVHSVVLLASRSQALNYTTAEIQLAFCRRCGFITNQAFDLSLHDYTTDYESTQSCSPTFNEFNRRLAASLIDRHKLHGKRIFEIGCGQGEFLTLLCEMGNNSGLGYDPAYVGPESGPNPALDLTIIKGYFSASSGPIQADLVCCKMTLEHIHNTQEFVSMIRDALPGNWPGVVFIQVPDATRILEERAFWDIYYEHCSYFTPVSLRTLFEETGFNVLDLSVDYGGQYLLLEARLAPDAGRGGAHPDAAALEVVHQDIQDFSSQIETDLQGWRRRVACLARDSGRVVIWGAGSKGVAFLTSLDISEEIAYGVDINPRKWGSYLAGTGQEVVGPEFLKSYRPDAILVMNPIYIDEIGATVRALGVEAELIPVQ